MLTKNEKDVMTAIYELCEGKDKCMVSAFDLIHMLPDKTGYDEQKLETILNTLELDDYFDIINSERKGEKVYVITLHNNGVGFKRELTQIKRKIYFKIALSVGGAILAFVCGMLLRLLFA